MPADYDERGHYIGWSSEYPDAGRDHGSPGGTPCLMIVGLVLATIVALVLPWVVLS